MKRMIVSSTDIESLGDSLRQKRYVGLNDAIKYMNQAGSKFHVNYRNLRGYVSGYMTNSNDSGDGISVSPRVISSLERYLENSNFTRMNQDGREYSFVWKK